MRVYLDSSAALKRVLAEPESVDLVTTVDRHHSEGDLLVSSSLAWIEVARAVRALRWPVLAEAYNQTWDEHRAALQRAWCNCRSPVKPGWRSSSVQSMSWRTMPIEAEATPPIRRFVRITQMS